MLDNIKSWEKEKFYIITLNFLKVEFFTRVRLLAEESLNLFLLHKVKDVKRLINNEISFMTANRNETNLTITHSFEAMH